MDGSSLPEPPHRDGDTGNLRSLLSRAVANSRSSMGTMPAGGNPFARFAHDGSAPGGVSAATAAAGYKQTPPQIPMPMHGLAPAPGPASAAGVRPPAMMNGMGAAPGPYRQEDEMDDLEPSAKRRRPVGRGMHREDDEDDGEPGEPGLHVGGNGAAAGMPPMPYPSSVPTDPSTSLYHTNPLPMGYTTTVTTASGAPGDHAHFRRNAPAPAPAPNRLTSLHQPTRPGLVVHAGAATPGGGFRSITAGAHPHHAPPLPTAATATHGPSTLAAIAVGAYGETMPGAMHNQQVAWPPQGMVPFGAGGIPGGMPGQAAMHGGGLVPNFTTGAGGSHLAAGGHHMVAAHHMGGHMAGGAVNPYGAYGVGAPGMIYGVPQRPSAGSEDSPLVVVGRRRRRNGAPADLSSGGDDDSEDEGSGGADADAAEEVLQRVESISRNLKGALGGIRSHQQIQAGLAGLYGGGGPSAAPRQLVTAADIARAVGSEEVAARLKPYQLVGINYLLQLAAGQVGGAILADEMGLGKTAQTCVYLSCLRPLLDDPGPHLVVVPASLLENWQRELRLWAPNLKVVTYYGPAREQLRHRIKRQWARICAGLDPGPDDEGEQLGQLGEGEEGQGDEGADGDDGYGDGGSGEEEEEVDEEEYGQMPPPVRQSGKGGGCGGLFDVLLTTYTVWEREGPAYGIDRAFLSKWPWSHVVMDEAHALKNSSSTRSKKLRKVAQLAATRIMLTGTPLQNDLLELHALLAFLLPTIFYAGEGADALAEQVAEVARPVPGAGSGAGAAAQAARAAAQGRLVERMKQLLQPFILRRLKSEVADQLVAKQQHTVQLDMVPEQRDLYAATIASMRDEVSKEASQAAPGGGPGRGRGRGRGRPRRGTALQATAEAAASSPGPGGGAGAPAGPLDMSRLSSSRVQHIFTQLRKVAQHPLLIRSRYTKEQVTELANLAATRGLFGGTPTVERCLQELSSYSDHQLHCFALGHPKLLETYILPEDAVLCSAKIRYLDELLPKLKSKGSRVLLFSQWTTVLDLLEWYMHLRGYHYCRLDGGTQVEDRLALVDAFNAPDSPYFVFLLSTRAGGQGLNLTGADTVILHDVDFNPQIDKQAEDRAHRLGQTRTVSVYRLITRGTVDSNIQAIAERKLALDAAVLTDVTVGAGAEGGGRGRGRGRGRGAASAAETRHMAEILSSLLTPAAPEEAAAGGAAAAGDAGGGGGFGGWAGGSGGGAGPSGLGTPYG
ncbi:hypothetical protein PLESTB_000125600 [Pleodorina starrii]|uniref:Uncharacterized protein n=1 Tax=Pleodorina starrii TaxID=330485 RepID=A0A9W6BBE8_9CHLO|nr:hypothetical protein PLESTB_000125600 [Pleodorina starrii]GLC74239.1 hypothetical protein PLESTF_001479700 [Pleodorina starrii]